jgi:hypothetical protein
MSTQQATAGAVKRPSSVLSLPARAEPLKAQEPAKLTQPAPAKAPRAWHGKGLIKQIRQGNKEAVGQVVREVKRAQGNLTEVSEKTGVGRETLRKWQKRHAWLKEVVEEEVKKNPILRKQRGYWTLAKREEVSKREQKHHENLSFCKGVAWGPPVAGLPEGVSVGKRAVWEKRMSSEWHRIMRVPVVVLFKGKKLVGVAAMRGRTRVMRRIRPECLKSWEARFSRLCSQEQEDWFRSLEQEYEKYLGELAQKSG